MNILAEFNGWCAPGSGLVNVIKIIKLVLNVLRFAVPIGLIAMSVVDISKNVLDPDSKDGVKKLGNRVIAAVIVFLVPTIVNLVLKLVDVAMNNTSGTDNKYNLSECWKNAR